MAFGYGTTKERESEFQEVYFNSYLTGTLLAPSLRALFYSLGIIDELESLRAKLAPGVPAEVRTEAEGRVANLEEWLGFLDIRAPDD